MKLTSFALCAMLIAYGLQAEAKKFNDNPVISHRGAWKNTGHPQNSIASFNAAVAMGCYGSECDVWFTSDDSLVIFHDSKRNGKYIEETSYAELRAEPLSNGEKVPTLREYIANAKKQHKTKLIIDIKTLVKNRAKTKDLALATHKLVCEMGVENMVEYLFGDIPAQKALMKITNIPAAFLGQWKKELPECFPDQVFANGIKYLDYQDVQYFKRPEWIPIFHKHHINLNAWTINTEKDMRYFLEEGFNALTTDEPEQLLKLYKELKKSHKKKLKELGF